MILNYIWIFFILTAFIVAFLKLLFLNDIEIFNRLISAIFDASKTGFEISIGLTGILSLWLGLMKIAEQSGLIQSFAKFASPVFSKLFPDIPRDNPVAGTILMNISANMLGLDNAATPIGLKAMQQLQALNPIKNTASNAMIMFLCINASGLTIIPITIIMYRLQLGAANPSDIFVPILIATSASTLVAILGVGFRQKINLLQKNLLFLLGGFALFIFGVIYFFNRFPNEKISAYSSLIANFLLFTIICTFIIAGIVKKVNVYDTFILGAKEGFLTAVKIIPYLIAILVAIGAFRASGAMDYFNNGISWIVGSCGFDTSFVDSLPTIIMKPLSGSGSRGMMIDAMKTFGADSFSGRLSCIVQGSTDTIFYIIAVYYGSVAIRKTRYTLPCALIADLAGSITAIIIAYLFYF